ncbi:MAG: hypothetical protein ACRD0S_05755, partial [Acidimicrobiales bacterium]
MGQADGPGRAGRLRRCQRRGQPRIVGIAGALEPPAQSDPDLEDTWEAPKEGRCADCLRMGEWLQGGG